MSDASFLTGQQISEISRVQNPTAEELGMFMAYLESEYGTHILPSQVEAALYAMAWEMGHAYGYAEVEIHYGDLAELVITAYTAGTKGN